MAFGLDSWSQKATESDREEFGVWANMRREEARVLVESDHGLSSIDRQGGVWRDEWLSMNDSGCGGEGGCVQGIDKSHNMHLPSICPPILVLPAFPANIRPNPHRSLEVTIEP